MNLHRDPRVSALALLVLAGLSGCGEQVPDQPPPLGALSSGEDSAVASGLRADPAAPVELSAALAEMNASGLTGTATAVSADGVVVVVVEAAGVPAPGEYPAQLQRGTCGSEPTAPVVLNPVIGLADGTGESTTSLGTEEVRLEGLLSVVIHGAGGVVLSCGDLGTPPPVPPES